MTILTDQKIIAALAALVLLLAGCGPGTGGTGTGPTPGSVTFAGAGTLPSATCRSNCNTVALRLEDAHVELTGACVRFVHAHALPPDATGDVVLNGVVETLTPSGTVGTPGTLRLQFGGGAAADAPSVTVTLQDASGATLLGPVLLVREAANAGTPAECGP